MINLEGKQVIVTGATGFIGTKLSELLRNKYGAVVHSLCHSGVSLTSWNETWKVFEECRPEYCFHLAGWNGGIVFNQLYPANIFVRNTIMGIHVIDACCKLGVKKVVSTVASCAYPASCYRTVDGDQYYAKEDNQVCYENEFFDGPPHDSVACHAYAKRNLQLLSQFYNRDYGLEAVCACPATVYGPGDRFDSKRGKVMGALVKRFCDAVKNGEAAVTLRGTGAPLREFIYVDDVAELLVQTMIHYEDCEKPLNLGTGQEVSISDLASLIAAEAGFTGEILWDKSKPDGQYRKRLDLTRMRSVLPETDFVPLEEGISRTVQYYQETFCG